MSTENVRSQAREDRTERAPDVERAKERERLERETRSSLVRQQVIHALGKPDDLLTVQVRPLWATNYRVNVFVGVSMPCARISHSFFLVTDGDGKIVDSTPKLERRY